MEKIQINNQVISMRKVVKQAKVHVINKLVKEVKLLKARNGDEAKVAKCKRKAERLLLEINLVKKLSADSVSKMALSNKDYKSLSGESYTMEHSAMSRLINFGPLQKETEKFYSKFPHLVKVLPDIFQQWQMKKYSAFQGEKAQNAAEMLRRKGRCFKKSHTFVDFGHHEPVLNEKSNSGAEENLSEADILCVESDVEEKHCKGGKKKSKQPALDKLQRGRETLQNKAFTAEFHDASRNFFSKHAKVIKGESTMGTKTHHMSRLKSVGISNSSYCANKFKCSTKCSHKFGKLPYVEKSVMSGRMNKKPIVSGVSTKNVRKQETSCRTDSGANSKLKKRIKINPCDGVSRSNGKVAKDFSRPKYDVSFNRKSVVVSEGIHGYICPQCCGGYCEKTSASLHPSWAAKRKMNMEAKSFIPFQGKKIKFDE